MTRDRGIFDVLGQQHGVISRPQLLGLGVSPRTIDRWVAAGKLVGLHPGVYRSPTAPITDTQRLWAALVAAGEEAAVSHRSAAHIWSLRGVQAHVPEISVIHERPRLPDCHLHRMRNLLEPDVVRLEDGMPVTSVARTILDLGAVIHPDQVARAAIDALHRRIVRWDQLADVLAREGRRGRAGTAPLRRFMTQEEPGVAALESELEVRFWEIVRASGLPLPVRQHALAVGGRRLRIDFGYPELLLAFELDGVAWHGTAADRRRDRERDRLLANLGWKVLRFGWEDVTRRPEIVIETIAREISERRAA